MSSESNVLTHNISSTLRVKKLNKKSLDVYGTVTRIINKRCVKDNGKKCKTKVVDVTNVSLGVEALSKKKEARMKLWNDDWMTRYKSWLVLDEKKVRLFCKYCMEYPHAKSAYAKKGSTNFKTSNISNHARTQCHRDARNAKLFGKVAMKKSLKNMHTMQEDALHNLFKVAYFIGRHNLPFALYPPLLLMFKDMNVKGMTSLYNDDKACVEITQCIAKSIME